MRLLVSLVLFMLFNTGLSAQRSVLIEKFTNFSCGSCPNATIMIEELQKKYPDLILVMHHKPVGWIDNDLTNEDSEVLWYDLNEPGNPTAMVNRTPRFGSLITTMNSWEAQVEEQMTSPYYTQIEVANVEFNGSTRTFDFDVVMNFETMPTAERFSVTAMITEDKVQSIEQHSYFNEVSGHPLEGRGNIIWDYEHNNVVRAILDDPWGTNTVIPPRPQVGEEYVMHYSYTVPESYNMQNLKVVAAVGMHDNSDTKKRELFNSTQISLNDYGFNLSDTDELKIQQQISLSPNPAVQLLTVRLAAPASEFKIYSSAGQLMKTHTSEGLSNTFYINIAELPQGAYYLQVSTGQGSTMESFVVL